MWKIKIQSFGDIITNSSSEVFCIYDWDGTEQIINAVKQIANVLNPSVNIDDLLEIQLVIDEDYLDDSDEYSLKFKYNKKFEEFCESRTNEQILTDFPEFRKNFFTSDDCYNDEGMPLIYLSITGLNDDGQKLANALYSILNAYEYREIMC